MKTLQIKSPLRIDLAGGFLDIPPVPSFIENSCVVNCSIPLFTELSLKPEKKYFTIHIKTPSYSYKKSFLCVEELLKTKDKELIFLKVFFQYWFKNFKKHSFTNKVLTVHTESPVGAGLGGSSSLYVSLTKLFLSLSKQTMSKQQIIQFCRDRETKLLHFPAGVQDYVPALEQKSFALSVIRFSPFGLKWKTKTIKKNFLKNHLLLADSGQPHHSGLNNWKILKKVVEKNKLLLKALYQLRDNALNMAETCDSKPESDWSKFMQTEQNLKQKYFPGWCGKQLSSKINLIKKSGADGVKLCGAGGGGSILIFCSNIKRKKIIEQVCSKNHIPVILK